MAVQPSVATSERRSPLGEIADGAVVPATVGAAVSTVTVKARSARLPEASAVHTVIRYGPSGAPVVSACLPSQVKATVGVVNDPERTAGARVVPVTGWTR